MTRSKEAITIAMLLGALAAGSAADQADRTSGPATAAPAAPEPAPAAALTAPATPAPTKIHAGVGFAVAIPMRDMKPGVNASPGGWLNLGYDVLPMLRVFGSFRYIGVSAANPDGIDLSFTDEAIGVREQVPLGDRIDIFAEAEGMYGTLSASQGGLSFDESGFGVGTRAGIEVGVAGAVTLSGSASYTTTWIKSKSADWLSFEASLGVGF